MTDKERLDREAMEARRALLNSFEFDGDTFYGAVVIFEAAVDARARAEEREQAFKGVTRFEVIDYRPSEPPFGRVYSAWGVDVEGAYQDEGRTFKAFIRAAAPVEGGD